MLTTTFLLVAALLIALPYLAWRFLGLRAITPLAVLQIVVGILLGPSVLGLALPDVQAVLFAPGVVARIDALSAFAVVVYSFVAGLHLDFGVLRRTRNAGTIAWSSFLVPLVVGGLVGLALFRFMPETVGANASAVSFSLGLGLLIAVTALPVLAALLREIGRLHTPLGQQALGFAAINDAGLWAGLSVLLVLLVPGVSDQYPAWLPAYGAALLLARWGLGRAGDRLAAPAQQDLVLIATVALAFLSACAANLVGLGYVFGAFAAGVIVPDAVRHRLVEQLEQPAILLLMPFFFMNTGLKTAAGLLDATTLLLALALTGVAVVVKLLGAAWPAWRAGASGRQALALGMLLQTKGLMEVLVGTILLDAGVISPALFTALVLMAVLCTTLATPAVQLLLRGR